MTTLTGLGYCFMNNIFQYFLEVYKEDVYDYKKNELQNIMEVVMSDLSGYIRVEFRRCKKC